jgi:hypothetical protein
MNKNKKILKRFYFIYFRNDKKKFYLIKFASYYYIES